MSYWLSVVRFVPDPGRGEFINVAAIAASDDLEGDWDIRAVANWKRAKQFDDHGVLPAVMEFISDLQNRLEPTDDLFAKRLSLADLRTFSQQMRNVVQISTPVPVVVASAEAGTRIAFAEMIIDPAALTFPFEKKYGAIQALKAAYKDRGVPTYRGVQVRSGPYETPFDFAVANGKAIQLVRCWSFQLPNQRELVEEVKAWAWAVRALKLAGTGELLVDQDGKRLKVDASVDVESVFLPPTSDQKDREAFVVASEAFQDPQVGVTMIAAKDAREVAGKADQLLRA